MSFGFGPMQHGELVEDLGKDHEFVITIRGKAAEGQYIWCRSIVTQNANDKKRKMEMFANHHLN